MGVLMPRKSIKQTGQTSPGYGLCGSGRCGLARVLAAALLLVMAGCSSNQHEDLDAYVARVKAEHKGHVAPLPEIKPYATFAYDDKDLRDPFESFAAENQRRQAAQSNTGLHPDMNRKREALEAFSLDTLKYVGTLEKDGHVWGLIQAPDQTVHRVKTGDHMGQNYGKITRITENRIDLKEIVPNGLGGWVERDASLALKE